jgi:DNA polymerase III subunit beta
MKLTIKREPFEKTLEAVFEAIPIQTAEASFKNFLITITDAGVTVLGSDGSLTIQGVINIGDKDNPIVNLDPGAVQVPAKYLLDIVKNLQADIVTLELVDSNVLNVSDERSKFNLLTAKAEEYPDIDISSDSQEIITLKTAEFLSLYNCTSFAVATKGPKELFMGINITAKDGKLTFVATDSFRLARKSVVIQGEHNVSITVPSKALGVVSHITGFEFMSIVVDTSKALFKIGNLLIATKLYSGEFPNVDRIIPTGTNYLLTVNSKEFISSIGRITIVGNTKILVNATPEQTEISSKDVNVGSSQEIIHDAKFVGDRFSIIFNATFVTDAIRALNSEHVTLAFCAENRAFLVKNDDETITQVITPIRSLGD